MHAPDLTLHQMAGQRIIAGFSGTELNADLKHLINTLRVGGIILFARNIETRVQVRQLCADAQNYARARGLPPLFISVDQEGGTVARLKSPEFTEFPDAAGIGGKKAAQHFAQTTAAELTDAGFNMDMAPVMDVADPGIESIMARRAYGTDPLQVAELGAVVIRHLQQNRIMAVAKHFPGIGRTTVDSHVDLPNLDISAEALGSRDLIPFETAIQARVAGIMLSHIRYAAFDRDRPASLSSAVARDLLRKQMGYDGIVMTDDLEMGAIEKHYPMDEVIFRIMDADIDIALICRSMDKIEAAAKAIVRRLEDPEVYRRSVRSVSRIFSAKRRYLI